MERTLSVLLVSAPFGALERPALGLALLHSGTEAGHRCTTKYLGFELADRIGVDAYQWVCHTLPYEAFIGEWLFTEALYGSQPEADLRYLREVLHEYWHIETVDLHRILGLRRACTQFVDRVASAIDWAAYDVIGFTSTFHQNLASLAIAARVRKAAPDAILCFGGANWEGVMGRTLLREFPFVDVCFSGEADESFPAMLDALAAGRGLGDVPGISYRDRSGEVITGAECVPLSDIDSLPVPDFGPYFTALDTFRCAEQITPTLLLETARGCWWGARSHCTFCGLNGASMAFRSKSPDRAIAEIDELAGRWGVTSFSVVDNILDMRYFRSVLQELADREDSPYRFFWEVKANLSRSQVDLLARAGVTRIQPGIESMSDRVLDLMRKGTTRFRNVALLKWCREYGVMPEWNLLYGFPGEAPEDYEEMARLFPKIHHLAPPSGQGSVRLDRFSPYHNDPEGFGMVNVRPARSAKFLYPNAGERLHDISYYFDFDYEDGHDPHACAAPTLAALELWRKAHATSALWVVDNEDGRMTIVDERGSSRRVASIDGWKAAVYAACDRARNLRELAQLEALDDVAVEDINQFLDRCVATGLMISDSTSWLSLAVHRPPRVDGAKVTRILRMAAVTGA